MIPQESLRNRARTHIFLYPAAALLAGAALACAPAMAQAPGAAGGGAPSTNQQSNMPGGAAGAAGAPTTGLPTTDNNANSPQSFADQAFIRETMEGSTAQVQMSQLAQQKGSADDVKQYGEKMVQIHTQLNDQFKPLAQKLSVSEPKGPSKKEKQQIEKLQALSGSDFDQEYLKAMAKDQQHDVKQFKDEAQGSQDPAVQQTAKEDVPVLMQHLQLLQQIAQAHNVTLESKK